MKKKIMVLAPHFENSGAINVLETMVYVLSENLTVETAAYRGGEVAERLNKNGIPVILDVNTALSKAVREEYDYILVNTIQMYSVIKELKDSTVTVYWWIHEPSEIFEEYADEITDSFFAGLKKNIRILAAGRNVQEYLQRKYRKECDVLNFGISDLMLGEEAGSKSGGKVRFLCASDYFSHRKGQDILAYAILNLPEEYWERTKFLFTGEIEEQWENGKQAIALSEMLDLVNTQTHNIIKYRKMPHDALLRLYREVDVVVAPSREDPTNITIVEGLCMGKLCVCSDKTGISRYIKNGCDGFVFESEKHEQLTEIIISIVENFTNLSDIGRAGRKVYEENFSVETFAENVRKLFD